MNEQTGHAGLWGIVLIVIVLVSWLFYRYFAPKSWREWAGAGLVQAFIIALYAEMYGFPLTIYLLGRFFGLDSDYVSANLWSTLIGLGGIGMLIAMLLGYGLAFIGIGLFPLIVFAYLQRLRPIVMTFAAVTAGLVPIMAGHGTGSEVMQRIAAPMIGGMITTLLLTLCVIPALSLVWHKWQLRHEMQRVE